MTVLLILCYIGNMIKKFSYLAPAPYTVVDYEYKEGGSACDHCGTFIKHVFTVEGSNGVKFQLGSQHVEDVGGTELAKNAKTVKKHVERDKRNAEYREQAQEAEAKRAEEYEQAYAKATKILAHQPHPNAYFASKGKTKLDYLKYFEEQNGKNSSRVKSIVYEALIYATVR